MSRSQLRLHKFENVLILLICLEYIGLLFLPIPLSNITLTALLLFLLFITDFRNLISTLRSSTFSKLILGMYLLQIVGLLYTENLKAGFFALEKKVCFVLLPVFLLPALQKVSYESLQGLFKKLGIITVVSGLVLLLAATIRYYLLGYTNAFSYESFRSYEGFSTIHYVYYSMYFATGSMILLDILFEPLSKNRTGMIVLGCVFIFCSSVMILAGSKTGIIAFVFCSIYLLYKRTGQRKIFFLSVSLLILSLSVALYFHETTRKRFVGLDENLAILINEKLIDPTKITDLNMRLLFWKIAVSKSIHDNLFIAGTGTGDVQAYLDALYIQYRLDGYLGYDSHNQWVHTFIQLGVMGLLPMFLLFAYSLKSAYKKNDSRFVFFLIIVLLFTMTESIFELNKGIVFFSLFATLFTASENRLDDNHLTQKIAG
jgi:O-antigen ligase